MNKCPNSDPNFDKVLSKWVDINSKEYPSTRKHIYYGVCIWVRFILYALVFYYRDFKYMPYIVGIFSIISILNLKNSIYDSGRQWWSKKFDLVISILLLFSCIGVIMGNVKSIYVPILLYVSLIGGIVQSFLTTFC